MSTGITDAAQRRMYEFVAGYRPRRWLTLHIYEEHWDAQRDREDGIFGQQIDNRQHLGKDMRAKLTNYYPDTVTAHWVFWESGTVMLSSSPVRMFPNDALSFDASRDISIGPA